VSIRKSFALEGKIKTVDEDTELSLQKSDGAVFQTQRAKDYYQNIIGDKGIIIPIPIGNELCSESPEIKNQKENSAMVRLSKQKDFATLIRAFKICLTNTPIIHWRYSAKANWKTN
jgi:hypothetical protein